MFFYYIDLFNFRSFAKYQSQIFQIFSLQGVDLVDLQRMHNLTATEVERLNAITFRMLQTELYIDIDANTIENLLRLAPRKGL